MSAVPDYIAAGRDFFAEVLAYLGADTPSSTADEREETATAEWASNGYSDEEVLEVLRTFARWPEVERVLSGEAYDDVGVDKSALDFRLCCAIAFVVGPDPDQVERILLDPEITAGRPDNKWSTRRGKHTYLQFTIANAIKHLSDGDGFFVGPGNDPGKFRVTTDTPSEAPESTEPTESAAEPEPEIDEQPSSLLSEEERRQAIGDTWLDEYLEYCALRTDAPAMFHEALGLIVLSAAVGQRGTIEFGQGEHTPMLWVLLVAPSTRYRKTTSLNLARSLIRDLEQRRATELLAPSDFTPQRFVAILAERGNEPVILVRDEFTGFYRGLNRLEYMAGAKELLCQLYDGTAFSREKMKPKPRKKSDPDEDDADESTEPTWQFKIEQPFLSIAAGTTPSYLLEVADPDDIKAGFLPRFALIVPEPIKRGQPRRPISQLTTAMSEQRTRLANELYSIATTVKRLTISDEALERFNAYLEALEDATLDAMDPETAGAVFERSAWMAFHVAQLLAAGSRPQETGSSARRRIDLPHMLRALDIAERWRAMSLAMLSRLAPSKFERMAGKIVQLVNQHYDGITRRDVMRALHINKKEMNDYEATLRERGEIRIEKRATTGGEQAVYYPPNT